jgi:hypothetical protein
MLSRTFAHYACLPRTKGAYLCDAARPTIIRTNKREKARTGKCGAGRMDGGVLVYRRRQPVDVGGKRWHKSRCRRGI